MKSKLFLAVSIMMLSLQTVHAQGHIKRAFNVLITDTYTKVESTHKLNKEPETGTKVGQLDVYEFTIPASHHDLIEDIRQAFDQDKEKAYSLSSTTSANKKLYNYTSLAVGGEDYGYPLGKMKNSRWVYALFLDPDDKSKTHRYAYAMEWVEKEKKITVRLAKTYATTMKYRTSGKSIRSVIVNGQEIDISDRLNEMLGSNGSDIWLSQFNTYKNLFQKTPDGTAASHYATSIYKLCKKPDSLDVAEKEIVAAEIKKLKAKTEDDFIRNLFDMSIERLKK